jgi:hypothetical protein
VSMMNLNKTPSQRKFFKSTLKSKKPSSPLPGSSMNVTYLSLL